jgi:hypothetical protein
MIEFIGKELNIEKAKISLPYTILDAEASGGRIFVIYDYMEFPMDAPAKNLVCIDEAGKSFGLLAIQPIKTTTAIPTSTARLAP